MKRKREEEVQKVEQRSTPGNFRGDGLAWFRGNLIGKGTFGSVYSAYSNPPFRCFPAVMAVKSAEVSVSGSIQMEREVFSNIGEHPNIIGCFGEEITTAENGETVYNLLLEYGAGGTLADLIKKSGGCGLPESELKRYARSILLGLKHIHECGYVHCDLKPGNILLVPRNSTGGGGTEFMAKIGDFGLTKRANQCTNVRGTPMYLSPEAVVDCVQEPPSDIWAFSCTVLEMLTGKPLWVGKEDLDVGLLLSRIGEGYESPIIPDEISKEGCWFLNSCLSRETLFRLTAEMLLNHPFLEGLVDDVDEVEEGEGILDADHSFFEGVLVDDVDDEAEMLLNHSFVEGQVDEGEEVDSLFMFEVAAEECSCSSFSADFGFGSEDEPFLSAEDGILRGKEKVRHCRLHCCCCNG